MWSQKEINFGNVKSHQICSVDIKYKGDKGVQAIEPLCNCVGYNFNGEILRLTWKIKKYNSPTESTKIVAIVYEDNTVDDITLRAYINDEESNDKEVKKV